LADLPWSSFAWRRAASLTILSTAPVVMPAFVPTVATGSISTPPPSKPAVAEPNTESAKIRSADNVDT
jgi:hypothetical protein